MLRAAVPRAAFPQETWGRVRVQQTPDGLELIVNERLGRASWLSIAFTLAFRAAFTMLRTVASLYSERPRPLDRGFVWDALALPALALSQRPSVLILGLGGGTAAQRIRELRPEAGISLDAFKVDDKMYICVYSS